MGLLTEGSPLSWEETKRLASHVREHGILQFINLYKRLRDRQGDVLKWGDEVEYIIVKFLDDKKEAKVSLRAQEILSVLNEREHADPDGVKSLWRPEYGAYMIEGTPGKPYGGLLAHFNIVEANMKHRREEVSQLLKADEFVMSLTSFPRLVGIYCNLSKYFFHKLLHNTKSIILFKYISYKLVFVVINEGINTGSQEVGKHSLVGIYLKLIGVRISTQKKSLNILKLYSMSA